MEKDKLLNELKKFAGTESYYKSTFNKMLLTEGIHFLRENAKCYWLIDIIESVQHIEKIKKNTDFIVWIIEKKGKGAMISAWNDTPYKSDLLYKQEIFYTDFPLEQLEFYQCGNILLLKSEY